MRTLLITMGTLAITSGVVINAYAQKKQFYPMMVYLSKSSPCMAVLYAQAFVFVVLFGKFLRKVFFGQLRPAETEHLVERSWYAITDTCLAFTMFRDDFNPRFVMSFTLLIFIKCFHWLIEDRVDYMERSPVISLLFKIRALTLLVVLALFDLLFVKNSYHTTMEKGASVQLVFGFEYAILFTVAVTVALKYFLHWIDLQSPNPWENKAVYMLYVELFTGFWRVILYTLFAAIMIKIHTFPLFAIRPMYLTLRQFKKTVSDIVLSRRAIRNMNTLYPNATAEELESGDSTCIICREEMLPRADPNSHGISKKLPCGHIFHASCLRSWFQRQQTCPTCRLDILTAPAPRLATLQQPQIPNQEPVAPPAGMPPFIPPLFPGMPPFQPPPPPTSINPANGSASSSTPNASQQPPPFMMPPPFMFPPPPPLPPSNYSGLSPEQLNEMEGSERRAVEMRLETLHNIRSLLDAAMIQIQQYMTVTQLTQGTFSINRMQNYANETTAASGDSTEAFKPDSLQFKPDSKASESTLPLSSDSVTSHPDQPGTSGLKKVFRENEETIPKSPSQEVEAELPKENETDDEEVPSSADELRRRRVERLSTTNLTNLS